MLDYSIWLVVFSVLDYADDIAILVTPWWTRTAFERFRHSHKDPLSWNKTKVQNLGTSDCSTGIKVQGQQAEGVDHFCYMGSILHSLGRSFPDLLRRIGIGSPRMNTMNSMSRIWSCTKISLATSCESTKPTLNQFSCTAPRHGPY